MTVTEDAITLHWTEPLKNGGLPLQGYVLEKREEGDDWSKCSFGLINDTQYRVCTHEVTHCLNIN